jgi:hypothetical protein
MGKQSIAWISGVLLSLLAASSPSRAAEDSKLFFGQWKATIPYQGVSVTIVSIHDAKGYKNYILTPQGAAPAGEGTFSAADGKWTAAAEKPNDSGTYQFLDKNTALCANALGQQLVWQRDNTPLPAVIGGAAVNTLPKDVDFTRVQVAQAIEVCRKMAILWKQDAVLVSANVFGPSDDGTVNILANPQAFTIAFYSPSAATCVSLVSTGQPGVFAPKLDARPPTVPMRGIPAKTVDLTEAIANEKLFGFTGKVRSAQMFFSDQKNKPVRLVWSLDTGEAYPRVVSAATGAILSPFEVYDDKVKNYEKLAAETAAAVAAMRAHHRGRGQPHGGEWLENGMHYWSGEGGGGGGGGEQDTWDRDVAAQEAWEAGDSGAEARFGAGEATGNDIATYGGGE